MSKNQNGSRNSHAYSPEEAGAIAQATLTSAQRMALLQAVESGDWPRVVATFVDLHAALAGDLRIKGAARRTVRRMMVYGSSPSQYESGERNRYPHPQTIIAEIERHKEEDAPHRTIKLLERQLREVQACQALALSLSGHRSQGIVTGVAPRATMCVRCWGSIEAGDEISWDRDWNCGWHTRGQCP